MLNRGRTLDSRAPFRFLGPKIYLTCCFINFLKRGGSAGLGFLFAVFPVYLFRVLLHRGGGSRIRRGDIARNIKKAEMIDTTPGQAADRRAMRVTCALNAGVGKRFVRDADTERRSR